MLKGIFIWLGQFPGGEYLSNPYIAFVFILGVAAIVAKLVLWGFGRYLQKFAKRTKTKVDDLIFERTRKPIFYFILIYGLKLAIEHTGINGVISKIVGSLMAFVFLFIFLRGFDVIIGTWGQTFAKKTKTKVDEVMLPLFHKTARTIFTLIGIMWVLDIWGVDIGPYLAGVGVGGLVLGFALQDSLKNIFGGVTLLLDKTFQVGDKIKLESGEVGEVQDIGLRSTKMRTYDNEVIFIPNGYLANSRVQNYTRPDPRVRVQVVFGIEYGSDVDAAKKVVLDAIKKMKDVLKDPAPDVQFVSMGDSALDCKALFWVEEWGNAYGKKLEATQVIYEALEKAGIGIPFPTRTIYMKK